MARGIAETLDEARLRTLLAELGREAARFRFEVAPNPCVGAAVLAGGVVIARGFHEVWGEAHAEVRAFDAAEKTGIPRESWEALVVTLDPEVAQVFQSAEDVNQTLRLLARIIRAGRDRRSNKTPGA